jgi:hypothetical protein
MKTGRKIREFRYRVEVCDTEVGGAHGKGFTATPVDVQRIWGGGVPCTVLYTFQQSTASTRDEAIELARNKVRAWIADGAPGSD